MTGKRMRKMLMAYGMQRNAANLAVHARSGQMPHETMMYLTVFDPTIRRAFEQAQRYGAEIKATFGDVPEGKVWTLKR